MLPTLVFDIVVVGDGADGFYVISMKLVGGRAQDSAACSRLANGRPLFVGLCSVSLSLSQSYSVCIQVVPVARRRRRPR